MDRGNEELQVMRQMNKALEGSATAFITPNLLIVAQHEDGVLTQTVGTTVKAEPIELDHIKVTKEGQEFFYELGENVKWMEGMQ